MTDPKQQVDRLAVELRQIAALLQHGSLVPIAGVAHIDDKPDQGIVIVGCDLLLKQSSYEDRVDLHEWSPEDEDYMVDVYTRREWRQRRHKAARAQLVFWLVTVGAFNLGLAVVRLKGWI